MSREGSGLLKAIRPGRPEVRPIWPARILAMQPDAMQLRYLSSLTEIANDRSNTIIFAFPAELRGV